MRRAMARPVAPGCRAGRRLVKAKPPDVTYSLMTCRTAQRQSPEKDPPSPAGTSDLRPNGRPSAGHTRTTRGRGQEHRSSACPRLSCESHSEQRVSASGPGFGGCRKSPSRSAPFSAAAEASAAFFSGPEKIGSRRGSRRRRRRCRFNSRRRRRLQQRPTGCAFGVARTGRKVTAGPRRRRPRGHGRRRGGVFGLVGI